MLKYFVACISIAAVWAQAPAQAPKPAAGQPAKTAAPQGAKTPQRKAAGGASEGVDTVIALVKSGLSESMVMKTLQRQAKAYNLTPADLLKLQQNGVSETIINAMMDPGAPATAAATPPPAAAGSNGSAVPIRNVAMPVASSAATPFPPPLDGTTGPRKRRLAVQPFEYSAVKNWVTYWFKNDVNIGEGIRAMLTVRMHQSKNITLLERSSLKKITDEQDLGNTNRVKQGTKAKIGNISGADCILLGDIVIFGRDDTTKRKGLGGALGSFVPIAGKAVTMNKEEKAVVAINLRIVDAETGEVVETAEARGESSRKSKDWGALVGVSGAGGAAGSEMTSSNFEATIIGEATSDAVTKVVQFLETRVPQIPAKAREIEGRVANITGDGIYLTVGADEGVLAGDRFEILRIKGEVLDPATKQVIDVEAEKVGEMVVHTLRPKVAIGPYGGQPLSASYAKGYTARLMSK